MTDNWTSYSALTQHRKCPQKWFYSHVRRYERIPGDETKVELEVGNWWHALRAAESIERGRRVESLRSVPDTISTVDYGPTIDTDREDLVSAVLATADTWWGQQTEATRDEWLSRIGDALPHRLRYLDEEWHAHWEDQRTQEQPLAVEFRWKRRLPESPDGDPETTMVGGVDEIYYDARRGMVVARDHKAHKDLGRISGTDEMLDSQLQIYAWGAHPDVTEWGLGPIRAVAYDRVRSVAPKPPMLTKSGRLSTRGGEPSVSSTDLRTYLEWAKGPDGEGVPFEGTKKDGSAAGHYVAEQGVIDKLDSDAERGRWFVRSLTPLNRNVIGTHLRSAVDTAMDVARTRSRAEVEGHAGRNLTDACKWCDFQKICRAEMVGGPAGESVELADFGLRKRPPRRT